MIDGDGDGTARIDIGPFEAAEPAKLVVAESGEVTVVNEAGTDTVDVSLSRQPTQPVVVNVSIGTPTVIYAIRLCVPLCPLWLKIAANRQEEEDPVCNSWN